MSRWTIKTRRGLLEPSKARAVWARFGRYVRPHRWKLLAALGGAVGAVAMQIAAPWPIKVIFDYILSDNMSAGWIAAGLNRVSSEPIGALGWVCGAILVFAGLDAAFSHLRDVLAAQTGQRVVGRIRLELYTHLQTLSPSVFQQRRTGDLLMRLTGDVQMLRQMLVNSVITAGQSLLVIVAMVAAMAWLNPTLTLLGLATVPLVLFAAWRTTRSIRAATHKQREKESLIATLAHDVFGAMEIVQAFGREEVEQERFKRQNRTAIRAGVRTTRLESRLYRTISIASAAGMCAMLYVGVRSVLTGAMTAGDLLVFVAYLRGVQKPLRNLAKLSGQVAKATVCGQRIGELFAIQPAIVDRSDAVALDGVRGAVAFDDVEFAYDDGSPAVRGVSLDIRPGQRVAIVGRTGAGKSTLAKLLLRFYDPQRGSVRIDGRDVRDITIESLRRNIAWVHQETVLFGMTVAENIGLGRPDADRDLIEKAARGAHADDFIEALPDGYDTVLGQDGTTLSGGERQRIALARALLREAPILILDEPAVGLDAETRRSVEQAWMSSDNTVTTLVICHRLENMDRFDRIVVLSAGRVAESGGHAELLAADGAYAALYAAGRDDVPGRDESLTPGVQGETEQAAC